MVAVYFYSSNFSRKKIAHYRFEVIQLVKWIDKRDLGYCLNIDCVIFTTNVVLIKTKWSFHTILGILEKEIGQFIKFYRRAKTNNFHLESFSVTNLDLEAISSTTVVPANWFLTCTMELQKTPSKKKNEFVHFSIGYLSYEFKENPPWQIDKEIKKKKFEGKQITM